MNNFINFSLKTVYIFMIDMPCFHPPHSTPPRQRADSRHRSHHKRKDLQITHPFNGPRSVMAAVKLHAPISFWDHDKSVQVILW